MEKNMQRVDVILDMEPDYLLDDNENMIRKPKRRQDKTIRISEKLFNNAVHEGLLIKTDDGYLFVGNYEDLKAFKKKKY
jgi:hypothetical protein